jgi:hexosaminidase
MFFLFRFAFVLTLLFGFASCKEFKKESKPTSLEALEGLQSVIPKPESATPTGKTFVLTQESKITMSQSSKDLNFAANFLASRLGTSTGYKLPITSDESPNGAISLTLTTADTLLGDEGYKLVVEEDLITLSAFKPAGIFRGIQTLRQLLPDKIESDSLQQGPWEIATCTIVDHPKYKWRGSMLDVARHFFSIEDVKRYIDLIAFYKMNVLHLHLSDDQGWRIEIKSWPNLTTHGGSTEVGGGKGGFYTQEQYKELINYATERHVTIVPEIDLPGHTNAALASYPELNCNGKAAPLYKGTEVGFSSLCIKKEITFKFVDDVIRELSDLTPTPYIHIGGDEAKATKKADYIQFVNKFSEIVKAHGKKMVGWEEIGQASIDSNSVAQYWSSKKHIASAVEKGAKIIFSPSKKVYLDMKYDSTTKLGLKWAAYIEIDSAYNWDPKSEIKDIDEKQILGVEAPLWSETIQTMDDIEFLMFPRLPGVAEIGWSTGNKNLAEYKSRLGIHGSRLKRMNVNFYRSKQVAWRK